MQKRKSIKNKQDLPRNLLSLIGFIIVYAVISPIPLIIGIRISQYFHFRLYTGFAIPLFLLGSFLAIQVLAKLFKQVKPVPLFSNWQDYIVAYSSFVVFCVIAFLPAQINYDVLWAYFLSFAIAFPVGMSVAYFFGSDEIRKRISNFLSRKKKKRVKQVSKERRRLVILPSAILMVVLLLYPAAILVTKSMIWFGTESTFKENPLGFGLVVFLVALFTGITANSVIWFFYWKNKEENIK